MSTPTPHLEKLNAVLANDKLPHSDRPRVEETIRRYHAWTEQMRQVGGEPEEVIEQVVTLVNEYKLYVDVDLIFDSPENFLYRQKGQLKIDNSIIEEFLPWLIGPAVLPELADGVEVGPTRCFSALYFRSALDNPGSGGVPTLRAKDQDFAVSRTVYIRTSYDASFADCATQDASIAYVAAEIKTNLDKTMFQEACATAHDVKSAVAGSKYFLLCEWLDMTPLSTGGTDIDEVLILRGAKRLPSNVRQHFSTYAGRQERRDEYVAYVHAHPLRSDVFGRLVDHIRGLLADEDPMEKDALEKGYF